MASEQNGELTEPFVEAWDEDGRARHGYGELFEALVEADLEELRDEEERPEEREVGEERRRAGGGERARAEEPHRHHRRRGTPLPGHESAQNRRPAPEPGEHPRAAPAGPSGLDQAPDRRQQPPGGQRDSGQIERAARAVRLGQLPARERDERQPDGHV